MKDEELKQDFIKYLHDNPELRFWQALRNWSNHDFIMAWSPKGTEYTLPEDMHDTFYWEGKK